jgi:hypothetical protein
VHRPFLTFLGRPLFVGRFVSQGDRVRIRLVVFRVGGGHRARRLDEEIFDVRLGLDRV